VHKRLEVKEYLVKAKERGFGVLLDAFKGGSFPEEYINRSP